MKSGITRIIIAVFLLIPIQMILPFPYGLVVSIFLIILIIVLIIKYVKNRNRRTIFTDKNLKHHYTKDESDENKNDGKFWDGP